MKYQPKWKVWRTYRNYWKKTTGQMWCGGSLAETRL